jgi:antitoxin FitA
MPSITVRDVPAATRGELAARAAATGRSLQEYLRAQLIQLAARPDAEAWVAKVRDLKTRTGADVPTDRILSHVHADRG